MKKKQQPPYPFRMPQDLMDWMKAKAIENERSLNGELLHRLKESREREEEEGKPRTT